jgi:hypothetical protein
MELESEKHILSRINPKFMASFARNKLLDSTVIDDV